MGNGDKVLAGTDGSGKTYFMKKKIIPEASQSNKVAIIDIENEYSEVSDVEVKKPEKFVEAFKQGHDVVRYNIKPQLKEPLKPSDLEHNGEVLDKVLKTVTAYQGDLFIVLDEAHNFQSNSKMYSGVLYKILKQGDKYRINIAQASQEPQDFHRHSWNLGGDIIAFRMNDLPDKLDKRLDSGYDPRELGEYHYIVEPHDAFTGTQEYPPIST